MIMGSFGKDAITSGLTNVVKEFNMKEGGYLAFSLQE
jgi:hypothetical protein